MALRIATAGVFAARHVLVGGMALFGIWMAAMPTSGAQAGLAAFMLVATAWSWLISRRMLDGLEVRREHSPRVFEGDRIAVRLQLRRGEGMPITMLEVRDLFMGSLDLYARHLVPLLPGGWRMTLAYDREVDRHRGLYLVGPLRVAASDPLGIFRDERDLDCVTRLTVYPSTDPLPEYVVPGAQAPAGPSLDERALVGQGDEILSVREYAPGDPPQRVHWRTSARQGKLYVVQRNRAVQGELCVLTDLSKYARFGLGAESTTEVSILAAATLLRRAHEARHRFSLGYAHVEAVQFPAGSGLAHLHQLLDRLAVVSPDGETPFWTRVAPRALELGRGSRAVLIAATGVTPPAVAIGLARAAIGRGIAVDCVLIDETDFIKIYREQERDARKAAMDHRMLAQELRRSGARVFGLGRTRRTMREASAETA